MKSKTKAHKSKSRKPKTYKSKSRKPKTHKSKKRKTRKLKAGMGEKDCIKKCKKECKKECNTGVDATIRRRWSDPSHFGETSRSLHPKEDTQKQNKNWEIAISLGLGQYIEDYKAVEEKVDAEALGDHLKEKKRIIDLQNKIEGNFISDALELGIPRKEAEDIWKSTLSGAIQGDVD